MLQLPDALLFVPLRWPFAGLLAALLDPLASKVLVAIQLRPEDVALQGVRLFWQSSLHEAGHFQLTQLLLGQEDQRVEVRSARAVVPLRRRLSGAVLKFQAHDPADSHLATVGVLDVEEVAAPLFAGARVAQKQALGGLQHDMREVQRLRQGQPQPFLQQLAHLVPDPAMVRKRPFVRGERPEDPRVPQLPDQVQQSKVEGPPIERTEAAASQHQSHGDVVPEVALGAHISPHVQVVEEV